MKKIMCLAFDPPNPLPRQETIGSCHEKNQVLLNSTSDFRIGFGASISVLRKIYAGAMPLQDPPACESSGARASSTLACLITVLWFNSASL